MKTRPENPANESAYADLDEDLVARIQARLQAWAVAAGLDVDVVTERVEALTAGVGALEVREFGRRAGWALPQMQR